MLKTKLKWSAVQVAQLCPTLYYPMDYTVHGILLARILEWVAFPFSRGSSQPRDCTRVSCIASRFFTKNWAIKKSPKRLEAPKDCKEHFIQDHQNEYYCNRLSQQIRDWTQSESKRKSGKFIDKVQSGWSLDEKLIRVSISDKGGILAKTTESDSCWRQARVIKYQIGGWWRMNQQSERWSNIKASRV